MSTMYFPFGDQSCIERRKAVEVGLVIQDYEERSTNGPRIAAALLTNNRLDDLAKVLESLNRQTTPLHTIVVVDTAATADVESLARQYHNVRYVPSVTNLGGAGGFAYSILSALASGADYVWILDDDACPEDNECLGKLLEAAQERRLMAVSPLIIAPSDHTRLAFRYPGGGERVDVEKRGFIPYFAQLFNGFLVHRDVFFTIGLPDMKLFIRGDEVDFLIRLRKANIPFGTITNVAVKHPPGWGEVHKVLPNRLHALVPETDFKRYYFFRNRGYLSRRYRRFRSFFIDLIGYPIVFIVVRRGDWDGLRKWWAAFKGGLLYKFGPPPANRP
jgi:rhamnopyranosyl-N-acetylglucosaminyl-diphospho-decaprenol beta-1,3/1,4-galactofuranosyltransferase